MKPKYLKTTSFLSAGLLGLVVVPRLSAEEAAEPEKPDPQAALLLNRAVEKLAAAKQFSVNVEMWEDLRMDDGSFCQFARTAEIKVRRPDRVRLDTKTTRPKRSFYYNGQSLSIVDHSAGFFAAVNTPSTIDETLAQAQEVYGVSFPVEDILLSKPFGDGAAKAKSAHYLGEEMVLGTSCHHLAFRNETADWQAWVQEGPVATVRKVVIISTDEEGSPRLTALFKDWNFNTPLPDFVFEYTPPEGAVKIQFAKVDAETGEPESGKSPAKEESK